MLIFHCEVAIDRTKEKSSGRVSPCAFTNVQLTVIGVGLRILYAT